MDAVTFPSPLVDIVGALDVETVDGATRLRRLPAWTRAQVPTENFGFVVRMASGIRLAFDTTADAVELEATFIGVNPGGAEPQPTVVELLVDGVPHARHAVPLAAMTLAEPEHLVIEVPAPPHVVRFDGLGTARKSLELWLPHTGITELVELRASAPVERTKDARRRWVHHGSSISQGGEADVPTGTWPVVAAGLAGANVLNLGFSGNATGDPFVARTIRDLPADVISLEIGINVVNGDLMRRRTFEPVLHGFLDTVRDGHPDTPIVLIGPIPCPAVETLPGPTVYDWDRRTTGTAGTAASIAEGALSLDVVRESLAAVIAARQDARLHYLDGRELFRPDELDDLPDGLHPNARGYRRMGERFARLAFGPGGPFSAG